MKLAIPEHQGRVAPVFDCCRRMLIVVQQQDGEDQVADQDWSALPRPARPKRLKELTVDLLICGGISCWMEDQIRRNGIPVIPWIAGELVEVLAAWRRGRLCDPCFLMPGRMHCRRRWRRDGLSESNRRKQGLLRKGA